MQLENFVDEDPENSVLESLKLRLNGVYVQLEIFVDEDRENC